MATVYRRVHGMKLEKAMALTQEAQDGLDRKVANRARRAELILQMHRHAGHSFIEVTRGRVDRYIVLNDTRGQKAAMTIEFGRKGGNRDKNGRLVAPSEPVAALRRAVSLL